MGETKPFLSQTVQTASFAFWEYFRPLAIVGRFLRRKKRKKARETVFLDAKKTTPPNRARERGLEID